MTGRARPKGEVLDRTVRIEVTASLGRSAFEALYLELRRLAKAHGTAIRAFRVERVAKRQRPAARAPRRLT